MLKALDIETAALPEWQSDSEAALSPWRSYVTVIATWDGEKAEFLERSSSFKDEYVCHNGKFDYKHLILQGYNISLKTLVHDTSLMAVAYSKKIPEKWLETYDLRRMEANKAEGGAVHRRAGRYSLKTLAPYFLGVDKFWEVADHSDKAYATKDVKYTYELYHHLLPLLKAEGTYDFYLKLLNIAHMLTNAELTGIKVDMSLLDSEWDIAKTALASVETQLDEQWAPAYKAYRVMQGEALYKKYGDMTQAAVDRLKDKSKASNTVIRYNQKAIAAISALPHKLNLGSPSQLKWLFKEHFGLDVTTFDGEDESTGKAVLQRLAGQGRKDIELFLEYRKLSKLCTAFFPSYKEYAVNERIYSSFNITGTRTGRLSSSGGVNLQQIPKSLLKLFIPSEGRKFVYYDLAGIEPVLIAWLSECPELCQLLISGGNFHSQNVRVFFDVDKTDDEIKSTMSKERDLAKEVGLSLLYGAQAGRIHESSTRRGFKWTRKECDNIYYRFREFYSHIFKYKEDLDNRYRAGELVLNPFGRPCVPATSRDIMMQGFNTLVQSTGSDILLLSMDKATKEWQSKAYDAKFLLPIHDAAITEVREAHAIDVDNIIRNNLVSWDLATLYGKLPLKVDGGIRDRL